jgi:hypothetical protein
VASYRTLIFLGFWFTGLLALNAPSQLLAQPKQDVLNVIPTGPNGCYTFSLTNGNAQNLDINQLSLRILTPGFFWYSRTKAPASWTLSQPVPETLLFAGLAAPVLPGGKLALNSICLDRICSTQSTVQVLWQTFNGATLLTTDTLLLTCIPLAATDSVTVKDSVDAFILTLHNRNSARYPLDEFLITSLTPGITFSAHTNNSWITGSSTSASVTFVQSTERLLPDDSLRGFVLKLTNSGSAVPPYMFEWSTASELRTVTQSDLQLGKEKVLQDSVRIHSFQRATNGENNAYGLTLRNTHRPAGSVDEFTFDLRTPGFAFADSNSGPWATMIQSSGILRLKAGAVPLPASDSLPGFYFTLTNAGTTDSVIIIWQSKMQGQPISRDTLILYCPPTEFFGCDNFALLMDKSCTSSVHISNRHLPESPVTSFHFEIISGVERILAVVAPTYWKTDSTSDSFVHFSHTDAGLPPGTVSLTFEIAFSSVQTGQPFTIRWSTWYNGRLICQEDRSIVCSGVETLCDTVITASDGVRNFTYNVKNMHLPLSDLKALSFSVLSGNSNLQLVSTPSAEWLADSIGTDYIHVVHQSGGVAPGDESGGFDLKFVENTSADVTLQWCSEDSNGVICCESIALSLPQWRSCDSLEVTKSPGDCSAGITMMNMNASQLPVERLSVSIITPGREFDTIIAPAGWNAVQGDSRNISFEHAGGGLPAGSVQAGFVIKLIQGALGGSVDVEMCTWNGTQTICCEQESIPCAAEQSGDCDSLTLDAGASCCFELGVLNLRGPGSLVDSVRIRVLTPDVILYQSTVESPIGWLYSGTDTEVSWSTATFPIASGFYQESFKVCFDNDATGNGDFLVEVNTYDGFDSRCADTLQIQCNETLVVGATAMPSEFTLEQNYPNPFNPSTTLVFGLQKADYVTLEILDLRGKLLSMIADGFHEAGRHRVEFSSESLPSGVYFVRLRSGSQSAIRAITLLR